MVHLFDLCLRFGRVDTASALAMRGVEGCILEDHQDLGPFSRSVYDPLCDCEGGTRVSTAVGHFRWSKAFG